MYACNYFESNILNTANGTTATNITPFLALFLSDPTSSGGAGQEVSYTGYERMPIAFSPPTSVADTVTMKNSEQIDFAAAPSAIGTITHIGIYDSQVGGNMYLYGKLEEPLSIGQDESPTVLLEEIAYSMANNMSVAFKTKVFNLLRGQNIAGFTPHLGLFNGNPNGGGMELSGENYSRPELSFSAPSQSPSGQMKITNSAAYSFNRPSSGWGTWSYTAVMDDLTNGGAVWVLPLSPSKEIKKGYMPKGEIESISIAIN